MSDQTPSTRTAPRRRWIKILALAFAGLTLLLVAGYFIVTSSAFFKGVILPRAGKAMNAEVTVAEATISPFSRVSLRDLSVTPDGEETLLTAREVRLEYNLRAILGGHLLVKEVFIDEPSVTLIQNADGSSNLDPILQSQEKDKASEPRKDSEPVRLDIGQITLRNANVKITQKSDGGPDQLTEMTGLNFVLSDVRNDSEAKMTIDAALRINRPAAGETAPASLRAKIDGSGSFNLTSQLALDSAQAKATLNVSEADGGFAELNLSAVTLDCAITPAAIENLAVVFSRGGENLGGIRLHGPFNSADMEGTLSLEIGPLDRRALNLAGAPFGLDFGSTRLQSTNEIQITSGASRVRVLGQLNADELSVTQAGKTTPPYQLAGTYDLSLDREAETLGVSSLQLTATRNGAAVLTTELSRPMTVPLGGDQATPDDSSFKVTVAQLNLSDWREYLDDPLLAGQLNAELGLSSTQGKLALRGTGGVQALNATAGESRIDGGEMSFTLDVQAAALDPLNATVYGNLKMSRGTLISDDPNATPLPLTASVQTRVGLNGEVLRLDEFRLALAPTSRATNELVVTGTIDRSQPEAMQANLKVRADALDLGDYYDLFAGKSEPAAGSSSDEQPAAPASETGTEPEPVTLPFRDSTIDVNITRAYLHEVEVQDWQALLKLDRSAVQLEPFALHLNGAPVTASAKIGLDVPGYQYDVRFNATRLPVAPLANSFSPSYRGKASGDLSASLDIKGQGTTGANLRQHLAGSSSLVFTNANIQLVGPKARLFVTVLAAALRQPALMDSPLQWCNANLQFGQGRIDVSRFQLQTMAFRGGTEGQIPIADELMNSPVNSLPIKIALHRSISDRAGLIPAGAPADAAFVDLPVFLRADGTVGDVKFKTDAIALAGITATSLGGSGLIGGDAGKVIEGLGRFLGGERPANTDTNQSTNTPSLNPFNLFQRPSPRNTNSPSADGTAP